MLSATQLRAVAGAAVAVLTVAGFVATRCACVADARRHGVRGLRHPAPAATVAVTTAYFAG